MKDIAIVIINQGETPTFEGERAQDASPFFRRGSTPAGAPKTSNSWKTSLRHTQKQDGIRPQALAIERFLVLRERNASHVFHSELSARVRITPFAYYVPLTHNLRLTCRATKPAVANTHRICAPVTSLGIRVETMKGTRPPTLPWELAGKRDASSDTALSAADVSRALGKCLRSPS